MKEYAETFKALSDETRLRILNLLITANTEVCVCELVDSTGVPQYNISKHLKILKHAGLIEDRKEGRWVYFCIARDKNPFKAAVLKSISSIPQSILARDKKELKKRFSIRVNGKCPLGIQKRHLLTQGRR